MRNGVGALHLAAWTCFLGVWIAFDFALATDACRCASAAGESNFVAAFF